jgi:hypothetical protein
MYKEEIKGNREKIKVNEKLPYLVGNIVISFAYVLRDNLSVFCVFGEIRSSDCCDGVRIKISYF